MERIASVEWMGGLRNGEGKMTSQSGAISNLPYSFGTRFEKQVGTNPEELLASSHASCFTMAVASEIENAGFKPAMLHTDCSVFLEKRGDIWEIPEVQLSLSGEAPGMTSQQFLRAAESAKRNCPVSKLFRTHISMTARLIGQAA